MKSITTVALCTLWLLAPAALAAQTATSAPHDTADTKADPAPLPAGFKLTGFAVGSYAYSGRSVGDTAIVGRLYDRFQNRFMLNALAVVLDKPYDPAKFSAGFHSELLLGQDATLIRSNGFDLGAQADVPHLYVTLNIPTASGNGLQIKAGRMVTLMGLEVIETVANPNWSEANQFIYVDNFTGLGVSVQTKLNQYVHHQCRAIIGWDLVYDKNTHKSIMGIMGRDSTTCSYIGCYE